MIKIIYCVDSLNRFSAPDFEAELFVISAATCSVKNELEGDQETKPIFVSNKYVWDLFLHYFDTKNTCEDILLCGSGGFPKEDWVRFIHRKVRFCVINENAQFPVNTAKKINPFDLAVGIIQATKDNTVSVWETLTKIEDSIINQYNGVESFAPSFQSNDSDYFDENTPCPHAVIYIRSDESTLAFGDCLHEAIQCFGGLEDALDQDTFDSPSDKKSFKDLFNLSVEKLTFGDEDYGFEIYRGIALRNAFADELK